MGMSSAPVCANTRYLQAAEGDARKIAHGEETERLFVELQQDKARLKTEATELKYKLKNADERLQNCIRENTDLCLTSKQFYEKTSKVTKENESLKTELNRITEKREEENKEVQNQNMQRN